MAGNYNKRRVVGHVDGRGRVKLCAYMEPRLFNRILALRPGLEVSVSNLMCELLALGCDVMEREMRQRIAAHAARRRLDEHLAQRAGTLLHD